MANHSILLKKPEQARLSQLYQTKCDEVSVIFFDFIDLNIISKTKWILPSSSSSRLSVI